MGQPSAGTGDAKRIHPLGFVAPWLLKSRNRHAGLSDGGGIPLIRDHLRHPRKILRLRRRSRCLRQIAAAPAHRKSHVSDSCRGLQREKRGLNGSRGKFHPQPLPIQRPLPPRHNQRDEVRAGDTAGAFRGRQEGGQQHPLSAPAWRRGMVTRSLQSAPRRHHAAISSRSSVAAGLAPHCCIAA